MSERNFCRRIHESYSRSRPAGSTFLGSAGTSFAGCRTMIQMLTLSSLRKAAPRRPQHCPGNGLSGATLNSPVELYPFDLTAAQREYQASPQLGKTFDDFLARRLRGVTPVPAPADSRGRINGDPVRGQLVAARDRFARQRRNSRVWRLPVIVFSREQTVELSMENAYEKTKKF